MIAAVMSFKDVHQGSRGHDFVNNSHAAFKRVGCIYYGRARRCCCQTGRGSSTDPRTLTRKTNLGTPVVGDNAENSRSQKVWGAVTGVNTRLEEDLRCKAGFTFSQDRHP
ncbi:uncharacterized protein LOC144391337 [Gasterosteus aculeatus]